MASQPPGNAWQTMPPELDCVRRMPLRQLPPAFHERQRFRHSPTQPDRWVKTERTACIRTPISVGLHGVAHPDGKRYEDPKRSAFETSPIRLGGIGWVADQHCR